MAQKTANLELVKPDGSEPVDILPINGNMDILDAAVGELQECTGGLSEAMGGIAFRRLTREEYDALTEKDSSTVYIVDDSGIIEMYVGEGKIKGGGSPETAEMSTIFLLSGLPQLLNMTKEE